jgi:4-hydroxy-tetrahydrodipicolinate synthase
MEGTVALKHGLLARGILEHATVRSPLVPLDPGADVEIANALRSAGLVEQPVVGSREARERSVMPVK